MEKSYLPHARLSAFLDTLRRSGELHGPTLSEFGVACFAALDDTSKLHLDYRRTQIPPKKYLLPFREELLRLHDGSYRPGAVRAPKLVLFGVHPCDLAGIAYLDRVFLDDRPDPGYAARRAGITLVGISCQPDDFCYCPKAPVSDLCDLFLSECRDGFLISAFTPAGEAMVAAARQSLVVAGPELLGEGAAWPEPGAPGCAIEPQDPQLRFSDHPLWDRFARTCVSCGACSVCCPTCYCFDVREYPNLSGDAVRLREWDNCLFKTHGEVAGGNFRSTRLDRLRYRFLHKYCGFSPLQGMTSCVGCGRCKQFCPVGIDLRELFAATLGGEPT